MKIASVRIQNFRSFVDETIPLNDYSCLVVCHVFIFG